MGRTFVKAASTADMLSAFQNKIDELEVTGSSESIKCASSADMLDAFYQKIDELEDVESSTDIEDEGIFDEGLESVEGADSGYEPFMLIDYTPDNGENGMEGDDFGLIGKFFATDIDDADAQLQAAFETHPEKMAYFSNPYVSEYNEYFDDGEEVYSDLATLLDNGVNGPNDIDIYEIDENGMPVFNSTDVTCSEDNPYNASFSFEADEAKMDQEYENLWSLADDNAEVSEAISKFDADYHGEYEPLRFVLEVGYGLTKDDYVGVPPFTVYITNPSIPYDNSSDMIRDLAIPGTIETYGTDDVEGCDTITAADDFDDDSDPRFDTAEDDWEQIDTKSIRDFDGFLTDYTLYHNPDFDLYVCVYGDRELYRPEDGDWDAEFDNYDEAIEWFNSYTTDGE